MTPCKRRGPPLRMTLIILCALAWAGAACRSDAPVVDQRAEVMTGEEIKAARSHWPAGVAVLVDSARVAYSTQDYIGASALYRQAATLAPDVPAVWYGVYIAEHARGNVSAADSALAHALQLQETRR